MGGNKEIHRFPRVSKVDTNHFAHLGLSSTSAGPEPITVHRKIAVLGFIAVGKSSLVTSFVTGTFGEDYYPTVEITYHRNIRFQRVHFATDIVDTAGMDQYSRVSRNASVGVHGYVLVFSLASRHSFEGIRKVNEALFATLGNAPGAHNPRVLIGSMLDMTDQRQVLRCEAQAMADSWGAPYLECSSRTGEHVADVFYTLLREIEKDDGLIREKEENGCNIL